MVRRRRISQDALPLPPHLTAAAVWDGPDRWRRERFEWSRQHEWPPGKIGFLAFFRETVALHSQAKNQQKEKQMSGIVYATLPEKFARPTEEPVIAQKRDTANTTSKKAEEPS